MPSSKLPPRSRQWLAILATAVLALTATASLAPPTLVAAAPDALPLARGDIAFESMRDGDVEIYVMNADGSGQTRLTNNPAVDRDPAWSPDGRQIVFASTRDDSLVGNVEIYVMNADGSGQTRLTNNPAGDLVPAWSPNGRQIAFDSYRDGNIEIYVMNVDGSGQTRLTNNPAAETGSAWSPDGTQIAFVSGRDLNDEIYVMNADGGGQTRLTNNTTQDFDPAWSPDGTQIAFESLRDGNAEIYVMNADGSGQARLTNNLTADLHPAWSPDGTQIAFVSNRDGNFEIYVMNADGGGQARLTNNPAQDGKPSWGFAKADAKADAGFALGREWAIPGDLRNTRSFFATFNAGSSVDLLDILFKPAWYSRFGDPKAFGQSPLSLNTPLPGFGHSIVDTNAQLGLDGSTIGDYSVFISSRNHDTASVAWHQWGQAEAAVGQVPPSADVTVPMVLNGWVGQYSKVYIQNADANTYLDLNVEVYQQGSATPAFSKPWGKISQKDAIMIDMRQLGLPSNFLGTMKLKSMSGATLNAETMVFQEGNDRAVYAFEGVPADAASARLIAPLFRRGFYGDTGISVANPNPGPVVVTVVYFGSNTPGNSCAGKAFSHGPYTIAANSGAVFYQGLGSERLPTGSNGLPAGCFGSAEIVASDNVMAIVNDAQTQGRTTVSAGAVVAQPWESASDLLNLPLVVEGDAPTGGGYTAGIQLTNTDLAPAQVVLQFHKQDGSDIRCPGSTCSFTVGGNSSYNYYLGGNVLPDPVVFASARLFADKPMIASVTIVRPGFDQSFYNAIAATIR